MSNQWGCNYWRHNSYINWCQKNNVDVKSILKLFSKKGEKR